MKAGWRLKKLAGAHGLSVCLASDEEQQDLVFRFRYHIYVEVMGRRQLHADHRRKLIREPMDEIGENYLALKDGQVIGTIRRNKLIDPTTSYYAKLYKCHLFEKYDPANISITTKLMMLPDYQKSLFPIHVIRDYALFGYKSGVELDLIDCNKPLVDFFERLGYFCYTDWVFHKEFGKVMPMFLSVDAIEYMKRLNSALFHPASKTIADGRYGGYELIREMARPPRNRKAFQLSQTYRSLAYEAIASATRAAALCDHVGIDPIAYREHLPSPGL